MLIQENYKIPLHPVRPITEDYEQLRSLGIAYIQALSKKVWTDFNAHDPGVTTLELLCYALTELGYRTNARIEDLLTENNQQQVTLKDSFFTATEILKQHPLTTVDYRKIVLDYFPEIKNVWFLPVRTSISKPIYLNKKKDQLTLQASNAFSQEPLVINGFYNVKIEPVEAGDENAVITRLYDFLMGYRNLCENFNCIQAIEHEYVGMCLDIDFDGTVDPLIVKKAIYKAMYGYVSPHIKRYTLQQMYEKGKTTEEIFSAYKPLNGFFDQDELENFEKKNVLYTSDIINILMELPGVKNVRKIHLNSYKKNGAVLDTANPLVTDAAHCLHLQNNENAFQFFIDTQTEKANKINFYYEELQLSLTELISRDEIIENSAPIFPFENDLPIPKGRYREPEKYYSIQNEFPNTYYIGQQGISDNETAQRKAQRLQFKGYLLHFEQLMADYLAQLSNARHLLSWSSASDYCNYYYQALNADEIKDLELLKSQKFNQLFDQDETNDNYYENILHIDAEKNFDRRNRFLNHLIARFNDSFTEFSIVQFFKLTQYSYEKSSIIADKKSFLRTFPAISADRLKAANYKKEIWNTPNLSGYEMRVAKKLGLTNFVTTDPDLVMVHSLAHPVISGTIDVTNPVSLYDYSSLPFDRQFGFHIVEHILLNPEKEEELLKVCDDDGEVNCPCKDPYSFRISVVLPGWLPISIDANFRRYVEKVLREELPAHITAKICWISPTQMLAFEQAYFGFMEELRRHKENCNRNPGGENNKLANLAAVINNLANIYPPSHLVDCGDIVFDKKTNSILKYPAVLGKVALSKDLKFDVNWVPVEEDLWNTIKTEQYQPMLFRLNNKAKVESLKIQHILPLDGNSLKITLGKSDAIVQDVGLPNNNKLACSFSKDSDADNWQFTSFIKLLNEVNNEFDEIVIRFRKEMQSYSAMVYINKKIKYQLLFSATEKSQQNIPAQFYIELQERSTKAMILTIDKITKQKVYSREELEKLYFTKQDMPDPKQFKAPLETIASTGLVDSFFKQVKKTSVKQTKK